MSSLARWFHANGYQVVGYDKTQTPLTNDLTNEGISVYYKDEITELEKSVFESKAGWLVVYTPAIPQNSIIKNYFLNKELKLYKRSQVLGFITEKYFTIAVAGTHGKTSTSCMLAHVLNHSGVNCTAFLGGIATNYNSNLIMAKDQENQVIVVEADEFDKSFLTLSPTIAIITTDDPDHLDIYGDHLEFKNTFKQFVNKISEGGTLIKSHVVSPELGEGLGINVLTYGEDTPIKVDSLAYENGDSKFVYKGMSVIDDLSLSLPGEHNVNNALATITACLEYGLSSNQIREGLNSFLGVKRRFEYILRTDSLVFIDDYAHHPVELMNCLGSVKKLYPNKKLTVIFQPHLFSRTQDFMGDFAKSLELVDELILLDIYPARELPIPGITSQVLFEKIGIENKRLLSKEGALQYISDHMCDFEVLLTVGAGDIGEMVGSIKKRLEVTLC